MSKTTWLVYAPVIVHVFLNEEIGGLWTDTANVVLYCCRDHTERTNHEYTLYPKSVLVLFY